ncbi:MAG: DNA polymerase III subunit delta', partial [Clostridiaceae bacterium]|nr:DNA polymerase III subunit delta' [Clostridiaceae bacterium]
MNFNDIAGQKEIVTSLKTQLENNKIGHAYIFSGPNGIGKRSVAKIFSALLLCSERDKDGSCGICQVCRLFYNNSNPDF